MNMNFRLLCVALGWSISIAAVASEPVAVFDAAKSDPTQQGWISKNDRPGEAVAKRGGGVLRIEDKHDRDDDHFFYFDLTDEQRTIARTVGFTASWRLRIPADTEGASRAISFETCIGSPSGADQLRCSLSLGRRGNDLLAGIFSGPQGVVERSKIFKDGGAFHDWTLVFDGKTQLLNLFVDGEPLLRTKLEHRDRGYDLVFGSRASGTGTSEWSAVRFQLGTGDWKLQPPLPTPQLTDVLTGGQGGYFAYRIPSLVVAPNGHLLVFCEARKTNLSDDGDIDLVQTRSTDGGKTWQPHSLIYEEGGDAKIKYGNPTAVIDSQKGTIWLATNRDYLSARGARGGGGLILFRSDDSGATWSKPIDISAQVKQADWGHHAFGPGIGIQIQHGPHAGRLVLPANFRRSFDKSKPSYSHTIYSDDHGATWKLGGVLGDFTNECQVAETLEEGKSGLLINMRNHWGRGGMADKSGKRLISRSSDGGLTWSSEQMDAALPEPPCQASLYRYSFPSSSTNSVLLFANPLGGGRKNLTVRVSYDEGKTWPKSKLLVPGSAAYCCMARLPDDRIGTIVETDGYGKLRFVAFDLDWLNE